MAKQNYKAETTALGGAGHTFTGYDWSASGRAAAPVDGTTTQRLDSPAAARAARRAWRRERLEPLRSANRQVVEPVPAGQAPRRWKDALHERVATWAHARVPGDPCIGSGC